MTTPNTPASTNELHKTSDVDSSATSQHHTLGYTSVQAAPGNHQHTGAGSPVLADYSRTGHIHVEGDVTSLISDLGTKASNTHAASHAVAGTDPITAIAESQVTNLVSDLAGKAATSHTHTEANVTNLVSDLAGKAASVHSHAEADVTGLVTDIARITTLEGFVRRGAGTPEAAVTAPVGTLYLRYDGGAGTTLYIKESGAGNTGWVAK